MRIVIESTKHVFTSHGGIGVFSELAKRLSLRERLGGCIEGLSPRAYEKFHGLLLGFIADAECLEDVEALGADQGFSASTSRVYSAKAYGDFLRKFSAFDVKQLNYALIQLSLSLRSKLPIVDETPFVLDIDSTTNEQHGKKMEGCAYDYSGTFGLSTVHAHDQYGLPYWHWVREGNVFSANSSSEVLHAVFSRLSRQKSGPRRYFSRADSAFCNTEYFNACAAHGVGAVVPMRGNILKDSHINSVRDWKSQNPEKKDRVVFHDGRECEIGQTIHRFEESHEVYRVIILRALKPGNGLFRGVDEYDYVAFMTNLGEHEMTSVEVIKFYRQRANTENFIREHKYGFDLKHYPCLKLDANRAYGAIAAFAYALMRFIAVHHRPEAPHFSKRLRRQIVSLPAWVVRHARRTVFRFMDHQVEEVRRWIEFVTTLQFATA